MGSHCHLVQIHRKVNQETIIETEAKLLLVPVVHKLTLGVIHTLPCKLVLQLKSHDGNTVQRQHYIYGVVVLRRVSKLTGTSQDVLVVSLHQVEVEVRCRGKVCEAKLHTSVLHTIAQYAHQTILLHILLEYGVELLLCLLAIYIAVTLPHLGLRSLNELHEHGHIYRPCLVVCRHCSLAVAVREQISFNIVFKVFFLCFHRLFHYFLLSQGIVIFLKVFLPSDEVYLHICPVCIFKRKHIELFSELIYI